MPLQRRLPKRGFRNPFREEFNIVNLAQLEARFEPGAVVDPDGLHAAGLVRRPGLAIKVLADGRLTKALTVKAHKFSGAARQKVEAAGGTTEVVTRV